MRKEALVVVLFSMLLALGKSTTSVGNLKSFNNVIVYSGNKAEVERLVTVSDNLKKNEYHTIIVKGFTQNVIEETVRIKSTVDTEILDVKLQTLFTLKESTPEYKAKMTELTDELNTLNEKLQKINLEKSRHETRLSSINGFVSNSFTAGDASRQRLGLKEALEVFDFQQKESESIHTALLALMKPTADLTARIEAVKKDINNMKGSGAAGSAGNRGVSQNTVNMFSPTAGSTSLDKIEKDLTFRVKVSRDVTITAPLLFYVTYTSTTASWSPEYDIRVESIAAVAGEQQLESKEKMSKSLQYRMEIDYFANVWQNTGEHWVDAPLSLSTSSPDYLQTHSEPRSTGVSVVVPNQYGHQAFRGNHMGGAAPMMMKSARMPEEADGGEVLVMESAPVMFAGSASDTMQQTQSFSTGDLGASHMFKVQYPVNVSSTDLLGAETLSSTNLNSALRGYKHLILVEKVVVDCQVFTFAVPSQDPRGFMMGWGKHSAPKGSATTAIDAVRSPLLASNQARVTVQGDNVGTVFFNSVMPGEQIKLSLGFDQQIHISTAAVLPTHKGQEEDKSTWFVTDKKKFRVRTDERTTTIRSSHTTKTVLVIVSENLPRSTEEDEVTVELLSPTAKELVSLDGGKINTNDDCIAAVLEKESADSSLKLGAGSGSSRVYFNKLSGNLYWAQWVAPGENVVLQYKYKIVWPAEKSIQVL